MLPLESSRLFGSLPTEALARLREVSCQRRFAAGCDIFKAGDAGDGVYVVGSGLVQIIAQVGPHERHAITRLGPGELFGEMAIIDSKPRSATAMAEADSDLYFIPREPMLDVLHRSPGLALDLLREVTRRLREFDQLYVEKVLQAERMALVGRFASTIAHDLKSPLSIVGIVSDQVCDEAASPELRRNARGRIRRQLERISSMALDIVEFTRGSMAQSMLAPTDYAGFVRSQVEDIRPELALRKAELCCENLPPAIPLAINTHRLSRVFHNLMLNAADAMPEGGRICLRFRGNSTEIVTEVEDSGAGIAPEIAAVLFEPFATHGKTKGTGLGLSIAKRIVEEHRGRISARNAPGGGALFTFTLPIPQSPASRPDSRL